jgi:hypothetical protein
VGDPHPRFETATVAPGSRVDGQAKTRLSSSVRTAVAWQPRRDLGRHEWHVVGRRLGGISRCNQWWLGDWVRYGSEQWGERYTQAAKITGYDPRSLANMASVSGAFDLSRRRDDLTWSHHVAVAGLPTSSQEAWLDKAAAENLSVADLRTELRAAHKQGARSGGVSEDRVAPGGGPAIICPRCGHEMSEKELRRVNLSIAGSSDHRRQSSSSPPLVGGGHA